MRIKFARLKKVAHFARFQIFARTLFGTATLAAAALAVSALSSCNLSISGSEISAEGSKPQALGGGQLGCLNGMADLIYRYWDGRSTLREVDDKWSCAQSAIKLFVERTHGKNEGYYTPSELRHFLQKYFIRDFTISDSLMNEAMEFKSSVLGGSTDRLGIDELDQLLSLLTVLREQSFLVHPFLPLDTKRFANASDEQVTQIVDTLVTAGKKVGGVLEEAKISYPFERLEAFLDEIGKIYPGSGPRNFKKRMPLLIAAKRVLISPRQVTTRDGRQVEGLSGRDATRAFELAARAYSALLRVSQLRGDETSIFAGQGRARLALISDDVLNLISDSIAQHPQSVIPFNEFETLFSLLEEGDLGKSAKPVTVRNLVHPVICKLVQGDAGCKDPLTVGLNSDGVRRLRTAFQLWGEGQIFLENIYSNLAGGNGNISELLSLKLDPQVLINESASARMQRSTADLMHLSAEAISEILPMFDGYTPLFGQPDGRLSFTDWGTERGHTLDDLSQVNWMRQVIRLLIQGYGLEPGSQTVTLVEFRELIKDLTPLLLDFHLVDPRQTNLDVKRFREASLFTYASNGDEYLDINEGTMYLAEVLSASHLASKIYNDMVDPKIGNCAYVSKPGAQGEDLDLTDRYARHFLDEACFRKEFFARFDAYADHMPTMQKYYKGLNVVQRASFKAAIEKASRQDDGSKPRMVSYIAEGMASVMQYVEVLFSKYDTLHQGYLGPEEGQAAYPVFARTLADFAGQKNDHVVMAIFTYLLKTGKTPEMDACGSITASGLIDFGPWLAKRRWDYQADRGRLLEIFAELTRLTGQKKPASCQSN